MSSNETELMPGLDREDAFEVQMRGYSRRQVDEFVAKSRSQIRDLEERLSRSLDEAERLRLELSAAREELATKPAHEEVSERVGQILKLADEEAKAQRAKATEEIARQREDAKKEAERFRAEAREQTERMLSAAQEQAENMIASARAEAEKVRNSARIESERAVTDATREAESTLASAKAQAKQMLDEATMRASAIHDGAERRLALLTSRHTETMRRLTEIRDVVTNLVASETARGSLEEEVAKSVASTLPAAGQGPAGRQASGQAPAGAARGGSQAAGPPRAPAGPGAGTPPGALAPRPGLAQPATAAGAVSRPPAAAREIGGPEGTPQATRPSPSRLAQQPAPGAGEGAGRESTHKP
jgi:cell division septum initiation protein DivIVA